MTEKNYSDEILNLYIDGHLDNTESNELHERLLDDVQLRERVCQIKAVRELIGYAYETVEVPESYLEDNNKRYKSLFKSMAAGVLLMVGAVLGWYANNTTHAYQITSATDVFNYFKHASAVNANERRIIMHVTTGDVYAIEKALDEAERLLASYRDANSPMRLDIVAYKSGINVLRVDSSPYVQRIENIIDNNDNVTIYACQNSIVKAVERENQEIVLMPEAVTTFTAQSLIARRLDEGWVYIKV